MKHTVWHSRNHKKYLLQCHLIFVTKYRKSILDDELSNEIKLLSCEICNKNGVNILYMETDKNHIHYMIDVPTNLSIEKLVKLLKSYTTYHIWEKYNLSKYYWKERTLWTDGYFICSIGNVSSETLKNYILNQG